MSDTIEFNVGAFHVEITIRQGSLSLVPVDTFDLPLTITHKSSEGGRLVYQLRDDKAAKLAPTGKDKRGNPSNVDLTKLTVSSSHPEIMTAGVEDGFIVIRPVGPLGTAQVGVTFDPGNGTPVLTGQLDVEVVGGDLASIDLSPGDTFDLPPDGGTPGT